MLTYLRKHSRSWLAYIVFGSIIVVFVLWGGSSYLTREAQKIAKVDRHIISMEQFSRAYADQMKQYQERFGDALTPEMLKKLNIKRTVLDQIINDYIIEADAKAMGVKVTDEDLQMAISQVPAFNRDGKFDEGIYRRYLEYEHLTPAEFEQKQRKVLLKQRFLAVLTENITVPRQEIEAMYHYTNDTYDLDYVTIKPAVFMKDVSIDQGQIQAYYDANKDRYKLPPKISIAAIEFPVAKYLSATEVKQEEVKDYYGGHKSDFTEPAKLHVRHILIKVPEGADPKVLASKEELAKKVYSEATSGQDFAALAAKYSQDDRTAGKGGDMGILPRSSLPKGLAQILDAMKPGEVKPPVRSQEGIQILKLEAREEAKAIPFEQVSARVMETLKSQRAKLTARGEAEKAFMALYEKPKLDFEGFAKANGLFVKQIGPFSDGQDIGITMNPEAMKKIFTFSTGELGEVLDNDSGYLVYMVTKKETARIPELKEATERIIADMKTKSAVEKAKEHARKLAASGLGQLMALNPASTGEFTRAVNAVPKLSMIPALLDDLDSLNVPKVYESSGMVYVVWFESKKVSDIRAMSKQQADEMMRGLLERKREMAMESYLEQARKRHKVTIEKERLEETGGDHRNVPAPEDYN